MKMRSEFIWEKKTDNELQFWPNESAEHYLASPTLPRSLVKSTKRSRISAPPALGFPILENLGILNAAETRHHKEYYQARANEDFHFIIFTTDGNCSLKLGRERINLAKNSLFLAPAATEYEFRSSEQWFNIWFHISATKEWNSVFGQVPIVRDSKRLTELKSTVDMYLKEAHSENRSLSILEAYAKLIASLIKDEFAAHRRKSDTPNEFDSYCLSLRNRLDKTLTTKDAAKELSITPKRLDSISQKKFSKKFAKHLLDMRMKKALELLENGNRTSEEIAKSVGFANKYSLSKAFKNYYGKSPKHFAEENITHPACRAIYSL